MAINLILVPPNLHGVHTGDILFFVFLSYIGIIFICVCFAMLMGVVVQTFHVYNSKKKLVHKFYFAYSYFIMNQKGNYK